MFVSGLFVCLRAKQQDTWCLLLGLAECRRLRVVSRDTGCKKHGVFTEMAASGSWWKQRSRAERPGSLGGSGVSPGRLCLRTPTLKRPVACKNHRFTCFPPAAGTHFDLKYAFHWEKNDTCLTNQERPLKILLQQCQ